MYFLCPLCIALCLNCAIQLNVPCPDTFRFKPLKITANLLKDEPTIKYLGLPINLTFFGRSKKILEYVRPRMIVAVHPPKRGIRRSICGVHLEEPLNWDSLRAALWRNWCGLRRMQTLNWVTATEFLAEAWVWIQPVALCCMSSPLSPPHFLSSCPV